MAKADKGKQMKATGHVSTNATCAAPQRAEDIKIMYRSKTFSLRQIYRALKYEEKLPPEVYEWLEYLRPITREDCRKMARPCPYVSCKHHLYLDIKPNGSYKVNFWGAELGDLKYTCALDIAEKRQMTSLEEIGAHTNLTRERVRQIEESALKKLEESLANLLQEDER